jgi:pyruvate kinase
MSNIVRNLKVQIDWEDSNRFQGATKQKLTKVVCTVGPPSGSGSFEGILALIRAGMNVCRLNMSHGVHDVTGQVVANFRKALALYKEEFPHAHVALMLDTKGPEIRTGKMKDGACEIVEGQEIKVGTDTEKEGTNELIAIDYKDLCSSTKAGNTILLADGGLTLNIKEVNLEEDYCLCVAANNYKRLSSHKNVHLPGAHITLPALQQKDIEDLKWGITVGVDMVAASFVKTADDVRQIRRVLGLPGKDIKIMSKIESTEGLANLDAIIAESDGIMVARGDLGVECPLEEIFLAQKIIISKCNNAAKPVVTATQMLESMIDAPRPTRAEATDVANAVLDGTDCVMLSGETAMGRFPTESVSYLNKISLQAEGVEALSPSDNDFNLLRETRAKDQIPEVVAMYAVRMQRDLGAKLIVTITETGHTSRMVAKYRPEVPIIGCSNHESSCQWLVLTRAVIPLYVDVDSLKGRTEDLKEIAIARSRDLGLVAPGDLVVVLSGVVEGLPGKVNRLTVVSVPFQ